MTGIETAILLSMGGAVIGSLWDTPARDTEIDDREERSKRLLAAGQDAYGREAYQAPAWDQQMQTISDLRRQATEGDPYARARLMQSAEQQAAQAQGAGLSAGPQNQALMARAALQQGMEGRRAASGEAAMADVMARRNATMQLAQAGQVLGQQQLESEYSQRGIGADMLMGMSELEQQQALEQARLRANMPTKGEQLTSMVGSLGSAYMMSQGLKTPKPKGVG